jgi:phenylacetate-CoA ligase
VSLPTSGSAVAARQAEVRALRVAQEAAAQVPAYARFLRLAGYDATRLRTFADFCGLPPVDKTSYLERYPLDQRCRRGDLARAQAVTLSSGSSGHATLWPRYPDQMPGLVAALSGMFEEHFRIRERQTLMVLAQAIGPWGFGTSVASVAHYLFGPGGVRGTLVTPGLDQTELFRFVEALGPHYDQTLLVSYPAVLPGLLEAGIERGIDWPALSVGFFTSGEGIAETQRERILRYAGRDPERLEGWVAGFGASEVAGLVGYETHLCLLLRRLCTHTPALAEALFGSPVLPSLVQYNPLSHFLQLEQDEVLLTNRGAAPLVRYNTHDRGGLLTLPEVEACCRTHGYDLRAELHTRGFGPAYVRPRPFLYVFGRSNAVIVHGGKIYFDQAAHVLAQPALQASNTGNFELAVDTGADGRATLRATVELGAGIAPTEALRAVYHARFVAGLQQINGIFRALYAASGGRIAVAVDLVPFGAIAVQGPKRQRPTTAGEPQAAAPGPWPESPDPQP